MASGIPCDIYVETLECKSINDAPIWMSQTENMISRYENKGLRAIVLLGQEAWASFVSLDSFPQDIPFFGCYASTNGIPLPDRNRPVTDKSCSRRRRTVSACGCPLRSIT